MGDIGVKWEGGDLEQRERSDIGVEEETYE